MPFDGIVSMPIWRHYGSPLWRRFQSMNWLMARAAL